MHRLAFKMQLLQEKEAEYKRRHTEIWAALATLLKNYGICDYSIFLDAASGSLFAYLKIKNSASNQRLSTEALMQKWWAYMANIMETNPDLSPKVTMLEEVFHLP